MNKIDINKSIPEERWLEFFDQFSDGNSGRHISIEILGGELGDLELIQNAPLMAMVYDPPQKGNKLTIRQSRRFANETGKDEVTYAHTVDAPKEVLTGQDANGIMLAVQIRDAMGIPTLIKLQPN